MSRYVHFITYNIVYIGVFVYFTAILKQGIKHMDNQSYALVVYRVKLVVRA